VRSQEAILDLDPLGGAGGDHPLDVLPLAAGDAFQREHHCPVADLLHRRAAQVAAELGMTSQQHGELAATVRHHLDQPLQASQGMVVQVVRLVDHQHDRLLTLADQVAQLPLA
jgi:hypothetical protein